MSKNIIIIRDTDPEELEKRVNMKLKDIERIKSTFHTSTLQYQTAAVPQMRGDKITGYQVEYSVMVAIEESI